MYIANYQIQPENVDATTKEIFTPFVNCYYIHSISLYVNGLQENDTEFTFLTNKMKLSVGYEIDEKDVFTLGINYFYIRPDDIEVLGFIVDADPSYTDPSKSKEIISKHYIDGQFSIDNGLYKNAVLNFGTTLEGILNTRLIRKDFNDLINDYAGSADKGHMHFIRNLRNRVHPNKISATQDVSRVEAIEARNKLEILLKSI